MKEKDSYSNVRKGQFLWMDNAERDSYLSTLKKKISDGYYYSETILTKIVDEIAPVMVETLHGE